MDTASDQLYAKHTGDAVKLHLQSKTELRAKRRAEWKQSQLTKTNGQTTQAERGTTGR